MHCIAKIVSQAEVWWLTCPWLLHHVICTSCCLTERDCNRTVQRHSYQHKMFDTNTQWDSFFFFFYNILRGITCRGTKTKHTTNYPEKQKKISVGGTRGLVVSWSVVLCMWVKYNINIFFRNIFSCCFYVVIPNDCTGTKIWKSAPTCTLRKPWKKLLVIDPPPNYKSQ